MLMPPGFPDMATAVRMPCGCTRVDDGEDMHIIHTAHCTSTAVLPLDRLARVSIENEAKERVARQFAGYVRDANGGSHARSYR